MCPCNEEEESVEHLIYVCSILEPPQKHHDKTHKNQRRDLAPQNNEHLIYVCSILEPPQKHHDKAHKNQRGDLAPPKTMNT